MANIRIIKNDEVSLELLDEVVRFDQSIFSVDDGYSFPDNYLRGVYEHNKDGIFVLMDDKQVIGYVNVLFMSDDVFSNYLLTRDYLNLKNEGLHSGENNMYFYTLALDSNYRDQGYVTLLLKALFSWLSSELSRLDATLKNVICEVMYEDGIKPALKMGFVPMGGEGKLGMYYSKDCLSQYMSCLLVDEEKGIIS